ncbi:50S ribosomal subunit protein L15 [uncultured spirochete]|uniref:Large ribosomal subunit protein uL15 n=1 Tax=uncultured spirochete TaxID=156406 RepID=A0A3P3XP50_9SPIR|nr:50S ribosomal subunit protein L15 [uncultured spirochete]
MADFNLHAPEGANRKKHIVGRGDGSGSGGTAGRGNKGQQSRSGGKTYPGFEGGQMPLYRRLPSRGFSNYPFRKEYQVVNLRDIEGKFQAGDTVDTVSLFMKGLVRKPELPVKVLGEGQVSVALTVSVDAVSSSAKAKIEAAGGKVEVPAATGSSADA